MSFLKKRLFQVFTAGTDSVYKLHLYSYLFTLSRDSLNEKKGGMICWLVAVTESKASSHEEHHS